MIYLVRLWTDRNELSNRCLDVHAMSSYSIPYNTAMNLNNYLYSLMMTRRLFDFLRKKSFEHHTFGAHLCFKTSTNSSKFFFFFFTRSLKQLQILVISLFRISFKCVLNNFFMQLDSCDYAFAPDKQSSKWFLKWWLISNNSEVTQ